MECDSMVPVDCRHRLEWMKDKPPIVALLSSAGVLAADECFDLLQVCFGEWSPPVSLQPQEVDRWLELYTDHRAVANGVTGVFSEKLAFLHQANKNEVLTFLLGDNCTLGSVDFLDGTLWRSAFQQIEVQFMFRVVMPCLLMFGKVPVELLASVGRGGPLEWDCIEKLVALDPLVVQHRRFARFLNCADIRKCRERGVLMGDCLAKPLPELSKRQVKMMLAGHMSRVSEILGHRFTEPEIRSLFDATVRDRGQGVRDPDIPESPEAFSKAIQRYRKFWKLPSGPDKEIEKGVRALETMLS